jgi:transposase
MPKLKRKPLQLDEKTRLELERIVKSRNCSSGQVKRARILLLYYEGKKVTEIARQMNTNRPLIERCIDKAQAYGPMKALEDLPRKGRNPKITDDAKSWVLSIACQRPVDLGYAAETWTYSQLIKHIRANCVNNGYSALSRLGKGKLNSILANSNIKPHKVSYYLEKRDPEFEIKMANILCVYKEVEIINASSDKENKLVTISYDEKPGIQAIKNIAAQLQPVPGKYSSVGRDYEYKRLGTLSLLAGIDLHSGKVIPLVKENHRSKEFIEFLTILDNMYPEDFQIRIILDNHSAHISKETQSYLMTKPNRFIMIFTPKHGSWLNLIEMFFSKITRSFLRNIRVDSLNELIDRIYLGLEEINNDPVIFRWKYKMDDMAVL